MSYDLLIVEVAVVLILHDVESLTRFRRTTLAIVVERIACTLFDLAEAYRAADS